MKTVITLVVILALVGIYFWQSDRPKHVVQDMPNLPSIEQSKVVYIQVTNQTGERIQLHKEDVWMLGDKLANADAVLRVLDNLHDMQPIRVVTRNPEQYHRMQVSEKSSRILLSDAAGKILLDLHVGKQGSDLISTYVRLHETKEVIAVNKALGWQLNRKADNWEKEEKKTSREETNDVDPYSMETLGE